MVLGLGLGRKRRETIEIPCGRCDHEYIVHPLVVGGCATKFAVWVYRFLGFLSVLPTVLLAASAVCAQSSLSSGSSISSGSSGDSSATVESSSLLPLAPATSASAGPASIPSASAPAAPVPDVAVNPPGVYHRPTEGQKFRSYTWNALGPVAFAGSSVAAAIDQAFNFPHAWGQGADAYGARVASNLGISLVTASAQYSLAEAFHEDTAYYRCQCSGFFPRFKHAAISTVFARRGEDGHTSFSIALTASPFIGPRVAANSWIPSNHGPTLGFHMGAHNLLGQFGQDEALEFFYGGPHTLLGRIQRHFSRKTSDGDTKS